MATNSSNPKVDQFLRSAKKWREELARLRKIALSCGLTEDLKWGKPCYSFEGSNLIVLVPFKEYCSALFCKGALLKDRAHLLVKAGEQTQAARQMRFTSLQEIVKLEPVVKAYFLEAIAAEKAGLKVKYKEITEHEVPEEFQKKLDESAALKKAYEALTPGRRRAYLIYFSAAKQAKTREARVKKCTPQILRGKGLLD